MLRSLIALCLRRRGAVLALAAALVGYSVHVLQHARLDVLPDFAPAQVVVQTEAPGLSAEQVEQLVTRPLEVAAQGTDGVETLRSESIEGLSILTATFAEGRDVRQARQALGEALVAAEAELPDGVLAPRMTPLTSATMDLLKIGLTSETLGPAALRDHAQWIMRPRLLAVPGVAGVSVFGGDVTRLEVRVDPARLAAQDVTLDEVVDATRRASGVRGAGFVEGDNQRLVLQAEGQAASPEDVAASLLRQRDGRTLLIGDVAEVVLGAAPPFGDALIQGRPGVLLTMLSQYGSNTMDVTRGVEAALDELRPALATAGIELWPRLHRPASFIENALGNVRDSLLLGAALVVVVLVLFLYDLRTAFISLTAIPLSLGAAIVVLQAAGITINTLTLGGLAIALGEVVDDAIIDVENVLRRLRLNARAAAPRPAARVVLEASLEVRSAVVYATFIVALVFVPVLTMSGLQGRMFAPLAQAYILATLASLLVALTVTPALCLLLLPRVAASNRELPLLPALRAGYGRMLSTVANHRRKVVAGVALLCIGALLLLPLFGGEFLPDFREGHLVLHVSAAPGTSLQEMKRLGALISAELLANPHIATVSQQIGRAELGEDPWGPERSEFHVELVPLAPKVEAAVEDEVRELLEEVPGIRYDVLTFLGDRIGETLTGETADVVVDVFGEDLHALAAAGEQVARALRGVPGAVDVQQVSPPDQPRTGIALRRERLAQLGFAPLDVLEAVQTAYQGRTVAQVPQGAHLVDVAVILDPRARQDPELAGRLQLSAPDGTRVTLDELADVRPAAGPALLLHDGGRRRQSVTCNVSGRDTASFLQDARRAVAGQVLLPPGTYLQYGGTAEAMKQARTDLLARAALVALGVIVLLGAVVRGARNLTLVLLNLPFAVVGGILAAWLGGGTLTLGSLVGFVTLFGITTRNSIMLLSHFEHLVSVEGHPWNLQTAVQGATERLLPILMTALVTGLALLPLALGGGRAGREIEGPMAAVILGGLVTSTLLNLFVLPVLAVRHGRFGQREESAALETA